MLARRGFAESTHASDGPLTRLARPAAAIDLCVDIKGLGPLDLSTTLAPSTPQPFPSASHNNRGNDFARASPFHEHGHFKGRSQRIEGISTGGARKEQEQQSKRRDCALEHTAA